MKTAWYYRVHLCDARARSYNVELGLSGRVAIVGGSSRGIGFAAASAIVREGGFVTIVGRDRAALDIAAKSLRDASSPPNVLTVAADLSLPEGIHQVVSATVDRWEHIDIVINNLGGPPPGALLSFDDSEWQQGFDLSFSSAVRLNRIVLPEMIKQGHGRIISILSRSIREPEDGLALSTVARTALSSYSKLLAQEVASQGITVNNVLPGSIATDRLRSVIRAQAKAHGRTTEAQTSIRMSSIPVGRFGLPTEAADLIVFLASDLAGFITGQNVAVDGGQIKSLSV